MDRTRTDRCMDRSSCGHLLVCVCGRPASPQPDSCPYQCAALTRSQAPRRPSSLAFSESGTHLIEADKFGDVYRYNLASAEEPEPLLGQTSLITDVVRHTPPHPAAFGRVPALTCSSLHAGIR